VPNLSWLHDRLIKGTLAPRSAQLALKGISRSTSS
jgi:hypothetical protein